MTTSGITRRFHQASLQLVRTSHGCLICRGRYRTCFFCNGKAYKRRTSA